MNITVNAVGMARRTPSSLTTPGMEINTMYDMYPEWGPAMHDQEHPQNPTNHAAPVQESMDLRDNGGQHAANTAWMSMERPDDN